MKLAVISHACITPENQEFFQRIADASGWQVTIILPSRWKTDFKEDYSAEKLPGFKGQIVPVGVVFRGSVPLHFYRFEIFRVLRRLRPDVIYVHNEPYGISTFEVMLYNRLRLGKPIGFYAAQNLRKHYPLPIRMIEKFVFRNADYCFPVTESAAQALATKGFRGRIAVLPLGVTEKHLQPPVQAQAVGAQPFVIGYVGRLVPEKGIDVLLRALALVPNSTWECRIIGEGELKESLQRLATELGIADRIRFVGYVPHGEVSSHMHGLSVLALPSLTRPNWTEQFGRVIIEALAQNVPVIGTSSGEIPFLLRKLGGGIVVPEGDAPALAAAIADLIASPARAASYAAEGKRNVEKYFLESKIAADFVQEIQAVTGLQ